MKHHEGHALAVLYAVTASVAPLALGGAVAVVVGHDGTVSGAASVDASMARGPETRSITLAGIGAGFALAAAAASAGWGASRLRRAMLADPATGLPNRRALLGRLRRDARRASHRARPLSLVLLDIDATPAGTSVMQRDHLARALAYALRKTATAGDFAARWDGGTFALVLPDGDLGVADRVARVAAAFAHYATDGEGPAPTFAVGVAEAHVVGPTAGRMVAAADTALGNARAAAGDARRRRLTTPLGVPLVARRRTAEGHVAA